MKKRIIEDKDLVSLVDNHSEDGKHDALDMQNFINLAYFVGQQWISIDPTTKQLFTPPKTSGEVRYTANKIQPIVRTELAKMTKNKPVCNVIPATADDADIQAAHVGEKACEAMEFQLKLPEADKEAILYALTGGISFIKPFWNDNLGIELEDGLYEGDVDKDVLMAFEVKWDPAAKKWDDVNWVQIEKTRTVEYVKIAYGKDVGPEKDITTSNIFESKLSSLTNYGSITYNKAKNSVVVKECWEKPSADYKNGRRITVANGTLLYYTDDIGFGPEDKSKREIPVFPLVHIDVPGRVAGQSVIENLIPIQRERNKSRSQIIKSKGLVGSPPWVVQEGSLVDDIRGEEGEIIEYYAGMEKPKMEQPPSMSADVYKNIDQCDEELEFVSGQHETSHGSAPAGVKSGIAISYLQEQDDTKLGPSINNFERYKAKYMSYILKIIKFKYIRDRTLNFVGKNNAIETLSFKGSELTSTDVRVIPGSSLPQSKVAKQDYVLNLVDRGVLNPAEDKALILKMLELGFTDDLYDEYSIDVNHAIGEHEKWLKGDLSPKVRDFYNHDVHIKVHNKFRKSDDYEQLPLELQQIIDQHVGQHQQYIMQKLMAAMPQQPNMPGGQNPPQQTPPLM